MSCKERLLQICNQRKTLRVLLERIIQDVSQLHESCFMNGASMTAFSAYCARTVCRFEDEVSVNSV